MSVIADIMSWILLTSGGALVLVGAIGLVRMPDVFTRVHAAGITDTAGAGLILAGLMIQGGATIATFKLFCLIVLLLFTSPVATHALARAALHAGIMPYLKDGEKSAKAIIDRGGLSLSNLHDSQSREARDAARRARLNEERRLKAEAEAAKADQSQDGKTDE